MSRTALIEAMARALEPLAFIPDSPLDAREDALIIAERALTAIEAMAVVVPREVDDETADGIWRAAYDEWAEFGALDRDAGRAALREVIAASPFAKGSTDGQ